MNYRETLKSGNPHIPEIPQHPGILRNLSESDPEVKPGRGVSVIDADERGSMRLGPPLRKNCHYARSE